MFYKRFIYKKKGGDKSEFVKIKNSVLFEAQTYTTLSSRKVCGNFLLEERRSGSPISKAVG